MNGRSPRQLEVLVDDDHAVVERLRELVSLERRRQRPGRLWSALGEDRLTEVIGVTVALILGALALAAVALSAFLAVEGGPARWLIVIPVFSGALSALVGWRLLRPAGFRGRGPRGGASRSWSLAEADLRNGAALLRWLHHVDRPIAATVLERCVAWADAVDEPARQNLYRALHELGVVCARPSEAGQGAPRPVVTVETTVLGARVLRGDDDGPAKPSPG